MRRTRTFTIEFPVRREIEQIDRASPRDIMASLAVDMTCAGEPRCVKEAALKAARKALELWDR